MIPNDIVNILDKPGIDWEETPQGVVPVLPPAFFYRVASLTGDEYEAATKGVAEHCRAYTNGMMERAFTPLYGARWRMEILIDADRRHMSQVLIKQLLAEANLGEYIRQVQAHA